MRITVYGKEKWIKVQKLQTSLSPALRGILDQGDRHVILFLIAGEYLA